MELYHYGYSFFRERISCKYVILNTNLKINTVTDNNIFKKQMLITTTLGFTLLGKQYIKYERYSSIFMGERQSLHKLNSPYVQRAAEFAKLVDVFSFYYF